MVTVTNNYWGWFDLEKKHYPNAKTLNWPVKKCEEAHIDLMHKLTDQWQIKVDVVFDQIGDAKVVTTL